MPSIRSFLKPGRIAFTLTLLITAGIIAVRAQSTGPTLNQIMLADVRMRDVCILADEATKTYYAVSSTFVPATEGRGRPAVHAYTSKDLITWEGPHIIFQTPTGFSGDANIRASGRRSCMPIKASTTFWPRSTPIRSCPSSGATGCRVSKEISGIPNLPSVSL